MKRQIGMLFSGLALIGCVTPEEEESRLENETAEQENTDQKLVEDEEIEEETGDDMVEASSAIDFMPQENDLNEGYTVENDRFLEETEELVSNTSEDDLTSPEEADLFYTEVTMETEETDELRAIFLLTNRMDDTLENMEVTFSFGQEEEELLVDEATVVLEDNFGDLPPYTARPVYVEIDPDHQEELEGISSYEEYVEIEDFDYEVVD